MTGLKKKVLLVSSGGLDKSGVPSVIMAIVRGLNQEYDFDILLHTEKEGYFEKEFLSYGGRIFRCQKRRGSSPFLNRMAELLRPLGLYRETRRVLRAGGPYDVLHCHNDFDMAGCLAAGKKEKTPVRIGHTHKTWNAGGGALTRIYRRLCRRAIDRCATARVGCSEKANRRFYSENAPAQVVYDPYREDLFRFEAAAGEAASPFTLAQIGYFCENKNQRFTLEVFRALAKKRPDAQLRFVGDDQSAYGRELKKAAAPEEAAGRVAFLPPDADLPALLRESTALLLPSRAEGFGIVLIEAQAMGLPCYASDAVPRETDVGGVAYLSLSQGPEAWADRILADNERPRKIPRDCSRFATEAFLRAVGGLYGG